ncbi:hypothetical protein CR513_34471, partial [Mucuna pruriens]
MLSLHIIELFILLHLILLLKLCMQSKIVTDSATENILVVGEIYCMINPLTPSDILTLSTNEHAILDGKHKVDSVRELHAKVRANIDKRNEQYARFNTQRKYKLQPRGDKPFQVLEMINDNTYKLDLPIAYGNVSSTINVADLSLFVVSEEFDLRNPFEEGGNDRA